MSPIPKIICYKCEEKHGNWCGKFAMPIQLALQSRCGYGVNMTKKKIKTEKWKRRDENEKQV